MSNGMFPQVDAFGCVSGRATAQHGRAQENGSMTCVGVDGAKAGWIGVWRQGEAFGFEVYPLSLIHI